MSELDKALTVIAGLPTPPKPKTATELAIDALSANPPEYITPADIRKARRAARVQWRKELTEAVRFELQKDATINIKVIVETAISDIVKKVTNKVEAELEKQGSDANARISAEIRKLVEENLRKNGVSVMSGLVTAEATAYAKEMVSKNLLITLKEGNW